MTTHRVDGQGRAPSQVHVFANGGDHVVDLLLDRTAFPIGIGLQGPQIAAAFQGQGGDLGDERLKVAVAGHEVRFRVDLHDGAPVIGCRHCDQSFGGHPPGLFRRRREALLAQPIDGRFQVPAGLLQGLLAVHHAGPGLLAKFLHEARRDLSHPLLPYQKYRLIR